jgi:hypothetical protein
MARFPDIGPEYQGLNGIRETVHLLGEQHCDGIGFFSRGTSRTQTRRDCGRGLRKRLDRTRFRKVSKLGASRKKPVNGTKIASSSDSRSLGLRWRSRA